MTIVIPKHVISTLNLSTESDVDICTIYFMCSQLNLTVCIVDRLGVPKQALGGIPLDFGTVMEDKPSKLSCRLLVIATVV